MGRSKRRSYTALISGGYTKEHLVEKDLNNLINVIKGLHERLEVKAWKGKILININDYLHKIADTIILFSIDMSYVKGVETGLKEINNAFTKSCGRDLPIFAL